MTITYSLDVANTRFCGFAKLLGRWKGSIYKILWREFLVFIVGYSLISVTYRIFLNDQQKRVFESVVIYFEAYIELIPLSFVLGFYVSLVIGRWWAQYDAIPWPDRVSYLIAAYVHGADERSRIIRRTLGRYILLMQVLTFQSVSTSVKRRFPTTQHLVAAGMMTKEERTVFESYDAPYGKWWMPAYWFVTLVMRARKEGRIKDTVLLDALVKEFFRYRSACGTMFNYDWISVPLVYTQVVTLATYTYSLALMVGRQYLDPAQGYPKHKVDLYVPMFTLLQFFFYVGWLKVAEMIVNPYGEDDDDFELNWCLNRNYNVVYMLVDHFHTKHPKLRKDFYFDVTATIELPQTKITAKNIVNPQLGSAFNLEVNPEDSEFIPVDTLLEEDNDANFYNSVSAKRSSGVRYRPSFLMNMFNSNFRQSIRKRSTYKTDSFRESQSHVNPVFSINSEKHVSPTNSRKSSIAKRSTPSHSRASSISFHPSTFNRHRHRSYDMQHGEGSLVNGVISECEGTESLAPVATNLEGASSASSEGESNPALQKLDSHMPPIPEEPTSRVVSMASLVSSDTDVTTGDSSLKSMDDVQTLVAEASKVLEELNRVVTTGKHGKDCVGKGYESCCSLSSDDSSEEEEENSGTFEPDLRSASVSVDLYKTDEGDTEKVSVTKI